MIQIQNFSYEIQHKKLFKQVNTTFESKKIHTIYGDNGIGKTTFSNFIRNNKSLRRPNIHPKSRY
jgi:ATPase subunit of ABC transporter with duplicated ATPase domains